MLSGNGFVFVAPAGWEVTRKPRELLAAGEAPNLVAVEVFRLARPYRPALWPRVARELDGVAAKLASGLGGRVAGSRTVTVAHVRARQYELRYRDLTQQVTFVLVGRREYQLTCRRSADGAAAACDRLVSSFHLA